MVTLEPISKSNYREALRIRVTPDQERIIAPVEYSLAECYVFPCQLWPFLIRDGAQAVGFILLSVDPEESEYEVCRLMIDKDQQRRGYGRQAMLLAIAYLREQGASKISLSHRVDNPAPGPLYLSLGFQYTGVIDGPERLMELDLTR